MKFLFDLFPVILFFVSFKWAEMHGETAQALAAQYLQFFIGDGTSTPAIAPILLATAATMCASVAQIGYLLARKMKVDAMLWVSFIIVSVFGGLTIYFHSDSFIKWKPTVLYWSYGAALALAQFAFDKNLIRTVMESQIQLPERIWFKLGLAWIAFFALMGCINLFVAFRFPTPVWVNFKFASMIGIMPLFILAQSLFLAKHIKGVS